MPTAKPGSRSGSPVWVHGLRHTALLPPSGTCRGRRTQSPWDEVALSGPRTGGLAQATAGSCLVGLCQLARAGRPHGLWAGLQHASVAGDRKGDPQLNLSPGPYPCPTAAHWHAWVSALQETCEAALAACRGPSSTRMHAGCQGQSGCHPQAHPGIYEGTVTRLLTKGEEQWGACPGKQPSLRGSGPSRASEALWQSLAQRGTAPGRALSKKFSTRGTHTCWGSMSS